jgi:small conductance mechanosensitive channel
MSKIYFAIVVSILICSSHKINASEVSSEVNAVANPIAVEHITSDKKIEQRLNEILTAVGSYDNVKIQVLSGVVILSGIVSEGRQVEWVQALAARLDGVVAVQSQLVVESKSLFDFTPARKEIDRLSTIIMGHLPVIILAIFVLALSFVIFYFASSAIRKALVNRIPNTLLQNALAKALAIPVFLIGLYLALRISGLAGLALTLLGGTGLLGLALGLGLKNSFEDYVASIILSVKKPFRPSDWVRIGEFEGIVQQVNSRSTLIMDFTGNHILIPNSVVYNSIITNKSANAKMRGEFVVGIDYGDSIDRAQKALLGLLAKIDLVLKDPEPWVLVDELGGSSVNLRVYYWVNVREVSIFKVTSYLLREVKVLLLAQGFRFPDPQREIVFINRLGIGREAKMEKSQASNTEVDSTPSIADVRAEAPELNRLARESDLPDQGKNIL